MGPYIRMSKTKKTSMGIAIRIIQMLIFMESYWIGIIMGALGGNWAQTYGLTKLLLANIQKNRGVGDSVCQSIFNDTSKTGRP